MTSNTRLLEMIKKAESLGYNCIDMDAVKKALEENIREEESKKSGTKNKLTIIKRIIKHEKSNPVFGKTHPVELNGEKLYAFLEGHYILIGPDNFNYESAEKPFDIKKLMNIDTEDEFTLKRIDVAAHAKMYKKDFKPFLINYNGYTIGLDANKLLDCIDFAETTTIKFNTVIHRSKKCLINPFMLINKEKNIYAMLLPVNVEEVEPEKTNVII